MLRTWSRINRAKKTKIKGAEAPDRNDEYFLYQTLIGSYPVERAGTMQFFRTRLNGLSGQSRARSQSPYRMAQARRRL